MPKKNVEKNYLKPKAGKSSHNFGRSAAEQDPDLRDYYVDPDRFVKLALDFTDPAVFFVGPKGVGKSAILQMVRLGREVDEGRIINISPDDLAFSALAKVSATTPIISEAAKNQWLFTESWGVDVSVSTPLLLTALVEEAVSVGSLVRLLRFEGGNAHLVEVTLADDSPASGVSLVELGVPREATVVAVVRDDHLIVPRGDTRLAIGDEVLVLVTADAEDAVQRLLVVSLPM